VGANHVDNGDQKQDVSQELDETHWNCVSQYNGETQTMNANRGSFVTQMKYAANIMVKPTVGMRAEVKMKPRKIMRTNEYMKPKNGYVSQ